MNLRLAMAALLTAAAFLPPALLCQGLRPGVAAGMGVNYLRLKEVVELANSVGSTSERVPEFNAGVEFFARATWPLGDDWALALDYAYQVTGLNVQTQFGTAEFAVTQHAPALVVERVLIAEPLYALVAGIGVGFDAGTLEQKSLYLSGRYSASGPALLALLEGTTALGENLFASIGGTVRWGWPGKLTDESGRSPGLASGAPTLHQFGVGARLGLAYNF